MSGEAAAVDSGTREFLDAMTSGSRPHPDTLTMEQFRAGMSALHRWDYEVQPLQEVASITIPTPAGGLRARRYVPDVRSRAGVLVWAHGGSWVRGDLHSHENMLRFVASRSGWVVVSLEYRLAPEHVFPAALEDVMAAVAWVDAQRTELGAQRLAVGGDSSGANLAAAAAQGLHLQGRSPIDLQVLLVPVLDATFSSASWDELGDGRFLLTRGQLEWALGKYAPGVARDDPRLSPLLSVDLAGLPPAVIVCGELDPARDDARRYAESLRGSGVVVELLEQPGMIHHAVLVPGTAKSGLVAVEEMAKTLAGR